MQLQDLFTVGIILRPGRYDRVNCSTNTTPKTKELKKMHTAWIEIADKFDVKVEHCVCKFQFEARSWHRPKQKPEFRSMEHYSSEKNPIETPFFIRNNAHVPPSLGESLGTNSVKK